MPSVSYTPALQAEYVDLFTNCVVAPNRAPLVEKLVDSLVANRKRYDQVADLLDRTRPAPGEPDLRSFEWHYWDRRRHGLGRSLYGGTAV